MPTGPVGPIVFPDVVAAAIDGLRAEFTALGVVADVAARVPGQRAVGDGPLVTLRRAGGPVRDLVFCDAEVDVEAFNDEPETAHDLAAAALAVLRGLAGSVVAGVGFYRVAETTGATYAPDPESDQPRYVGGVAITVKGVSP